MPALNDAVSCGPMRKFTYGLSDALDEFPASAQPKLNQKPPYTGFRLSVLKPPHGKKPVDLRTGGPPRVHRSHQVFEMADSVPPRCTSQLFSRPMCPLRLIAWSYRRPDVFHAIQWFPLSCAQR